MTDQITDFTKSRLTQAFEAKGNAGSRLLEELQPVVVVHDLERSPFPPHVRWSWSSSPQQNGAELPMAILELSLAVIEQTCIIDRIYIDSTIGTQWQILFTQGVTVNTAQTTGAVIPHDTRRGNNQIADFVVQTGTALAVPLAPGQLHRASSSFPITVDVGIVLAWSPARTSNPQIVVVGENPTNARINFHGRIFPVQS